MSPLRYAILGLLARRPRSGYQLSKVMDTPIGFFWSAGHSQIHPLLGELEESGLVSHESHSGHGPRPTKTYAITDAGRAELAAWVESPPAPVPSRDEFVLKVYSVWLADRAAARAMVQGQRDAHAQRLAHYVREEELVLAADDDPSTDPTSPAFAQYATLRAGLGYERHRVAWCDWLLERL